MSNVMAVVKLAPGEVGFYDDLTRIHLTISNPYGYILKGMDVTKIKRGISFKKLILVTGTLTPVTDIKSVSDNKKIESKQEIVENKIVEENKVIKETEKVQDNLIVEEKVQEEVVQKKRTRKKKEE